MKWAFFVIVFVYMFYRAVYGVKEKEIPSLSLDVQDDDGVFVKVGERRVINCRASSKNQKVEWINPNGQVVSRLQSSRVYATQYFVPSMRSTGPSLVLTFSRASVDDTGNWECRSGDIVQNVSICVIETTDFEGTDEDVAADEGRSFTLSCQARGNPEPSISWYRNGEPINEDYTESDKYRMTTKYNSQGIEGLLTIMSLSVDDSGVYTCQASQESALADHCSAKEGFNITLNVNHAPEFGEGDAKEKKYAKESETLLLKCEANGYPLPKYRWYKKYGAGLAEYAQNEILHPDNGTSVLQVKVTEETYESQYICRASNKLGEAEKMFFILEPMIPEQPSQVILTAFTADAALLNVTWDDEILFDIDEVEVQYFSYVQQGKKRAASPKDSDWKTVRKMKASIGDTGDTNAVVAVNGLEDNTKYWMRLRVKNEVGTSPWSHAIKARTNENKDLEEPEIEKIDDQDDDEAANELVVNYTEGSETAATENPEALDESGKFYGLFFTGGILILAVGCSFLVRMV